MKPTNGDPRGVNQGDFPPFRLEATGSRSANSMGKVILLRHGGVFAALRPSLGVDEIVEASHQRAYAELLRKPTMTPIAPPQMASGIWRGPNYCQCSPW